MEVVAPDGGPLPAGAAEVEFYVPPFFPAQPAVEAMADLPRLRVVQALTAGIDRYLPYLPPGVTLCNARGAHDASTAEWVVAAILAAVRDLPYFALEQAAQRWSYRFTDSMASKTVLIVGYGSIGQAVEQRLAGFEVEVSRVARRARDGVAPVSDLPALLPTADVVVILAPVTAETIGMVDAGFLARMKDGALLVNAARGSLVVTDALVAELRRGRLRAAVDVTDPEPLSPGTRCGRCLACSSRRTWPPLPRCRRRVRSRSCGPRPDGSSAVSRCRTSSPGSIDRAAALGPFGRPSSIEV